MTPSARPVVLILGAGAAGLAAARVVRRGGAEPVVLEARGRVGGRVDTRTDPVLGIPLEHGAEFVHGHPPSVQALAREAFVRMRRVPDRHLALERGRLAEEGEAFARAEALLAADGPDDETVDERLARARRGRGGAAVLQMARSFVEGFYLADPRVASASAIARMSRALESIDGDAVYRPDAGWSAVLAPLARELSREAGSLRLSTRVERIRWRPGQVTAEVRGPAGGPLPPVRGARAIVTLPVGVLRAGAVRFAPALPRKARATRRLEMGPVVKIALRFRRPPWEEPGRPAELGFLHLPGAAVPVFWTLQPRRAPVLMGWVGGPRAAALAGQPAHAVLRVALRCLAPAFGKAPRALEDALDGAQVMDWTTDPLAGGGYAVFPAGAGDAVEELGAPVGDTLFFAGEATEPGFAGTVGGALRSGERAGREALASLRLAARG